MPHKARAHSYAPLPMAVQRSIRVSPNFVATELLRQSMNQLSVVQLTDNGEKFHLYLIYDL